MKKLKLFVLAMCASLVSSVVMAETKMGISAAMTTLSTSGSETLRESGNVTNKSIDEDLTVPSLFIEAVLDNGFAVGVDYVPVAELGSGTGDDDDAETSGANKASAELESHFTLYVSKELGSVDGLYIKGGVSFADVITTETLATGDAYEDTTTYGMMIGLGYEADIPGGLFARIEASYTDYDDVSITSTGGSKVEADIDATMYKVSVGKSF